jgi:hypothetical protein
MCRNGIIPPIFPYNTAVRHVNARSQFQHFFAAMQNSSHAVISALPR